MTDGYEETPTQDAECGCLHPHAVEKGCVCVDRTYVMAPKGHQRKPDDGGPTGRIPITEEGTYQRGFFSRTVSSKSGASRLSY
jgi:hypothetical protein